MQKEAAAREYANLRLQQPYERALYDQDLALQTRRWHVSEYETVVGDLQSEDLRARFTLCLCPSAPPRLLIRQRACRQYICAAPLVSGCW